ncbi:MAG: hypothetical protein ACP6IU_14050 [Candidatus Asgardarchaeia archaeon]
MLSDILSGKMPVVTFKDNCIIKQGLSILKPEEEGIGGVCFIKPCRSQKGKVIAEARFITPNGTVNPNLFLPDVLCFLANGFKSIYQNIQCNSKLGILRLLEGYKVITLIRNGKINIMRASGEKDVYDTLSMLDKVVRIAAYCDHCTDYAIMTLMRSPYTCLLSYSTKTDTSKKHIFVEIANELSDIISYIASENLENFAFRDIGESLLAIPSKLVPIIIEGEETDASLAYLLIAFTYSLLNFIENLQRSVMYFNTLSKYEHIDGLLKDILLEISTIFKNIHKNSLIVAKNTDEYIAKLNSLVSELHTHKSKVSSMKAKTTLINALSSFAKVQHHLTYILNLLSINQRE